MEYSPTFTPGPLFENIIKPRLPDDLTNVTAGGDGDFLIVEGQAGGKTRVYTFATNGGLWGITEYE